MASVAPNEVAGSALAEPRHRTAIDKGSPPAQIPRVAFLVKRFPRLSETFVLNEFLELRRQGLPLRLLAIMDSAEPQAQPEALNLIGEVTYLRGRSWWPLVPRVLKSARRHPAGTLRALRYVIPRLSSASWRRLAEALALVDELDGEQVHLHVHWLNVPGGAAFLANKIAGIPWSLTTHAKDLYTTRLADVADRCAQATFVATCTEANVSYLRDVVGVEPTKVVLCRHGVLLERFAPAERDPEPGRILAIGRLVPKKGYDVLIDAVGLLARRGVDFQLDIVGGGPLRDQLSGQIESLGLADRVVLHGARTQPELVDFYRRASVFALVPSVQSDGDRDGVPNVILEAMACGLPVVASAISGIPEVIEHEHTGLLVPPASPEAVASALEHLLVDHAAAASIGSQAATAIRTSFHLADCVSPLAELLQARLKVLSTQR
jgi:glycosyltransferase involved in cell wall biosynthesis